MIKNIFLYCGLMGTVLCFSYTVTYKTNTPYSSEFTYTQKKTLVEPAVINIAITPTKTPWIKDNILKKTLWLDSVKKNHETRGQVFKKPTTPPANKLQPTKIKEGNVKALREQFSKPTQQQNQTLIRGITRTVSREKVRILRQTFDNK